MIRAGVRIQDSGGAGAGKVKKSHVKGEGAGQNSLRYRSHISGNSRNSGFFASAIDASVAGKKIG
jgi:hypothetical protein